MHEKLSPFVSRWGRGGVKLCLQTAFEEWKHLVYEVRTLHFSTVYRWPLLTLWPMIKAFFFFFLSLLMTNSFSALDVTLASVPEVTIPPNPVNALTQNLWYYIRSEEGCDAESWPYRIRYAPCCPFPGWASSPSSLPECCPRNTPNTALLSPSASLLSETSVSPLSRVPCFTPEAAKSHPPLSVYFEAFGVCDESSPLPSLFWELGKASLYFLELEGRTSGLHFLVCFVKSTKQINTEPQNKQRKKKAFVQWRLILTPNLAAFLCLYFSFEHHDKFIFAMKSLSYSRLLAT